MIYQTTKLLSGQKAADLSVVLALAWPLLEGDFFITTIDCPLLMFWSITVYYLAQGLVLEQRKAIYLAGIALGLTMLSKYTAVLILPGTLIFLLLSPQRRYLLWQKDIYLALILALIVFSPVIIWNYQHNWVSFAFQFYHGVATERVINLAGLLDYLGATIGAANPFISLPLLVCIYIKRKQLINNPAYLLLVSIFIFVVLFFAYNSLYKFMEANWVAPAFISGIIFLAIVLTEYKVMWTTKVAISLVLILLPLIKLPTIFVPRSFHSKIPAVGAFKGNQQLYQQIKTNYLRPDDVILACDYGNASRGWYYLGQGRTYVLSNFKFSHSYANWNNRLSQPIKQALYFCDGNDEQYLEQLKVYFKNIQYIAKVGYQDSFVNNHLYVYRLSN
jgi:4-amino-4-deoxy-L-arabinose transferase-like glycosyltransferase